MFYSPFIVPFFFQKICCNIFCSVLCTLLRNQFSVYPYFKVHFNLYAITSIMKFSKASE